MDVREKLIELIAKAKYICANDYSDHTEDEYIADTLLDSGVAVQDGKPLEAFLHPVDAYKGLKAKYLVFKADTGERVGNCFVIRPDKDPAAVEAIRAYARATDNETLAEDIYNWVGKGEPVQEWISVDDRLPEAGRYVVCIAKRNPFSRFMTMVARIEKNGWVNPITEQYISEITHWMPLPQPPKGE